MSQKNRYVLLQHGARQLLPPTSPEDHKGSRGKSLILAGSKKFPGAGVLAAKAALRVGSGYVYWSEQTDSTIVELPDVIPFKILRDSWTSLPFSAILIGPGFGTGPRTEKILRSLKAQKSRVVIVDADALTVCAQKKLFPVPDSWILTPHPGELAHCLGISSQEVQKNRYQAISRAQTEWGGIVLLKGSSTLICDGKRTIRIPVGNEALAKSGTGDVLAGIITAFRAQGLTALKATLLGAYVHGLTSALWKNQGKDLLSMTASDVIELLPLVLQSLRET
jgi:ADP-dependent NAD(P)H-hydrate dehydratase